MAGLLQTFLMFVSGFREFKHAPLRWMAKKRPNTLIRTFAGDLWDSVGDALSGRRPPNQPTYLIFQPDNDSVQLRLTEAVILA